MKNHLPWIRSHLVGDDGQQESLQACASAAGKQATLEQSRTDVLVQQLTKQVAAQLHVM